MPELRRWSLLLADEFRLADSVRDVAFAPSLGRSFHVLAVACADRSVRIFKITVSAPLGWRSRCRRLFNPIAGFRQPAAGAGKPDVKEVFKADEGAGEALRVSWNATGTVLAAADNAGTVRQWQASFDGAWSAVASPL